MNKRKNNKFKKIIILTGLLLYVILLTLLVIVSLKITGMKVLPTKYLLLLGGAIVALLLLIFLFIFRRKSHLIVKILGIILELAFIVGLTIGIMYLKKTVDFLNGIKNKLYQTEEYYLVTLKESTLTKLDDIEGLVVGTYKDEINGNYNNTIVELLDKQEILIYEYDGFMEAAQALIDKKVEVIFVSSVYKVEIEDKIDDFYDNTKIIHKESLKIEAANIAKEVNVSKESFNVFISGIDTRGEISGVSRSDVNMVVTVNPDTNQILMTSIPRDYYVQLHGTTGTKDKITHAGMYGIKSSVQTVEDLLDIDINYYARVNFTSVTKIVNAIGGIEVNSPIAFTSKVNKGCKFKKGLNSVKGACALAFVRERYAFVEEGDNQRIKNQQEALRAIIEKAVQSKTIISKYSQILESMSGYVETNIGEDKIYELIKLQLASMPSWTIEMQSLKGYDAYDFAYSLGNYEVYVMEPDEDSIKSAKEKIKKVMNAISQQTATGR